jgi:hypothetical protein
MALFKRKSGIEPKEILKALWHLPVTDAIQPPTVVHEDAMFEAHCAIQPEGSREDRKVTVFPRDEHTMAQAGGQKHVA